MVPLQAFTRITEKLFVLGTPSLQPFLKSYWLTPVQLTGQLSRACKYDELERQYKCGARDNYVRIFSFTTDSCEMTSYCRTCRGGSGGVWLHTICGSAIARAEDSPECGPWPLRGQAHRRQRAARGPHSKVGTTIWREATVLNGRLNPQLPSLMVVSIPLHPSQTLFPSARRARRTSCPFQPQRRRNGLNRSGIAPAAKAPQTSKRSSLGSWTRRSRSWSSLGILQRSRPRAN